MFGNDIRLIGMIHVGALPGTPKAGLSVARLVERAVGDARTLANAGFHGLIIENMHDVPYLRKNIGPEIVAVMTRIAQAVREEVEIPFGVQILAGANREAMAVAHATGGTFIRTEGYVFASVADEGIFDEADAGQLLRERRRIGAEKVKVLADIKKKHSSHSLTSDVSIGDMAKGAQFCGADGVIVTGGATGQPTSASDVRAVREAVDIPVLVGSGVTPETAGRLLEHADAMITGSSIKEKGLWMNPIDPERAAAVVESI